MGNAQQQKKRDGRGAFGGGRRSVGVVVDAPHCASEFFELGDRGLDRVPFGRAFDVVTYEPDAYDTPEVAKDEGALTVWWRNATMKKHLMAAVAEIQQQSGPGVAICLRWCGVNVPHINGNR